MNPQASEKDKERRLKPRRDVQEILVSSLHQSTSAPRHVNSNSKQTGGNKGEGKKRKGEKQGVKFRSCCLLWQIDNNCLTWFEMGKQGQREEREE